LESFDAGKPYLVSENIKNYYRAFASIHFELIKFIKENSDDFKNLISKRDVEDKVTFINQHNFT